MSDDRQTSDSGLELPASLDSSAAEGLKQSLLSVDEKTIILDASAVERVGALCVQVLISASRTFEKDGREFAIINRSPAFASALGHLGISELEFGEGE